MTLKIGIDFLNFTLINKYTILIINGNLFPFY